MSNPVSVVLAGGGCRCFWSIGVLDALGDVLPEVQEWAGVSAGSAMAVIRAADTVSETMRHFVELTTANSRNFYPERIFSSKPVFPHEQMYRTALAGALSNGGFDKLRKAAPVRILLAYVKPGYPVLRTAMGVMRAYGKRKKAGIVHGPEENYPGIGAEVRIAQQSGGVGEIIDTVLYSSATPPVTSVPTVDGKTYVDGGMVDNVPLRALSEEARAGKVLILLTRPMPEASLPQSPTRFYLAPGGPVPIQKWDYASPEKLRRTFDQGRRDGDLNRAALKAFLA